MSTGALRLPRTLRLDASDEQVYEIAAAPGEWAVSGAFAFVDLELEALRGKQRQAFVSGFLGTDSFGRSTLVAVSEIEPAEYEAVVARLTRHFVERYGAPAPAAAEPVARAEAAFAASLCGHPVNTLLAVQRSLGDDGIVERFRAVPPQREPLHARIWEIVEDEDA